MQNAVATANSDTPVGTMMGPGQSFTLQVNDQLNTAADFKPIIVAYRNGAPVRLQDVASVVDSVENDQVAGWYNGQRSIILGVQRQPDANTVAGGGQRPGAACRCSRPSSRLRRS